MSASNQAVLAGNVRSRSRWLRNEIHRVKVRASYFKTRCEQSKIIKLSRQPDSRGQDKRQPMMLIRARFALVVLNLKPIRERMTGRGAGGKFDTTSH